MEPALQLQAYVQQCRSNGLADAAIKSQLLQTGWSQAAVEAALLPASPASQPAPANAPNVTQSSSPHRVRNGVLWIISPFVLLIGSALLQFLLHMAGIHSPIINIFSILVSLAGVILLPVGPIVGIIKLARH